MDTLALHRRAGLFLFLTLTVASLAAPVIAPAPAAGRFGFGGPEIFPIDNQFGQLRTADIDGDGLQDIVVVNNSRSKINILFNQTGKKLPKPTDKVPMKRELNELPPDARFRIDSIASEKRIASLVVTDLNGDGRPDIAYYGEPKELVVQYNQGTNGWSAPKRWSIEDGQLSPNALTHGDINGDKREDLVLLGDNTMYVILQGDAGLKAEPEKVPYTGVVKAVQILDVNGDRRNDLLLVNWDSPTPFRFRLQSAEGQLGPEIHFSSPPVRSYTADDLDGDGRTEIMTIAANSGRAQVSNFGKRAAEPLVGDIKAGQFQVLPLNKTDKGRRGVAWADVNGDGLDDLLVAEPGSGLLTVCLQQADGVLGAPKSFPTLTGVSELAVSDWDGDGIPEIFLLSTDERQVGVTRLDKNGRIAFPEIIPTEGRPLAFTVGVMKPGAKSTLVVVVDQDGKRTVQFREAGGAMRSRKFLESFKSTPSGVSLQDVNQDGKMDLVVLVPYEKIKFLVATAEDFEELDLAAPGGAVEQPWMTSLDVDADGKPELLLAQKNFLRAVVLKSEITGGKTNWNLQVKEQINGAASNSRITGATAVTGASGTPTLFLFDAETKALTVCDRDKSGVWRTVRNLPLPVTEFTGLQSISLGARKPNTVAFLGMNNVGWMTLSGDVWELTDLDGYETPIKDGFLMDVVTGDLNNDGRKDLVYLESAKNYIDIVTYEKPHRLVSSDRWQVFEERTFRSRRNNAPEPREAAVVDVTGDGKKDLVVIVHDRILVYPQE
ncbi:MAG TPA: VCBS repeat-containing protein [Roseimicrobium sp.]|nr:VCBS repeat-containing protein [Roseimicrobium sp.]